MARGRRAAGVGTSAGALSWRRARAACAAGRRAGRGRGRGGRPAGRARPSSSASKAPSTAALPSAVSRTSTPRRSSGSGSRSTRPRAVEPVDPVGHRAAGHQGLAQQPAGGELVRRAGPAQRGQHVELPRLDAVRGERVAAGQVEVPGQPADPAEHLDRGEVEVGALAAPGLDQLVHLVAHAGIVARSVENLDIKMTSRTEYLDQETRRMPCHTWDPDRYLTVRRRARPPVRRPARAGRRRRRPRTVVDLGCGPGNLTALLRRPLARRRRSSGLDSQPRDDRRRPAPSTRRHAARSADLREWARRARERRSTCWSPTPPCSGCPATSTCCRASSTACAPAAGSPSRCPATSTSPATPSAPSSPPSAPYAEHTARRRASPRSHDPAVYLDACADLGCAVDAWETTYLHVLTGQDPVFTWVSGTGARPTLQALPDDLRPAVRGGVQAPAARRPTPSRRPGRAAVPPHLRGRAQARRACRSRDRAPPRAGRLPARRRGRRPAASTPTALGLTEVEKPAALRGARRRLVPGVRRRGRGGGRAARRRRGAVRARPQGPPGLRRRRPGRGGRVGCAAVGLRGRREPSGTRSPATCGSTPATRHGNRVEVLQPA